MGHIAEQRWQQHKHDMLIMHHDGTAPHTTACELAHAPVLTRQWLTGGWARV